jgi:adenosylhomocysteine nucleosidase
MTAIPPDRILTVTGLKCEARIVRGRRMDRALIGGDGIGLAERLDRAVAEGPCAVLSVGIAGGLQPGLPPGTVIVASSVAGSGGSLPTTRAWAENLNRMISGVHMGGVADVSRIILNVAEKAKLYRATGALAVDMESHIVARIAHARRVPFAVLRIIADPAERSLPEMAQSALMPDGGIGIGHALKSLVAAPAQVGAAIQTALDTQAALHGLARCCRLAGPRFCLPDVGELLLDVS